MQKDSSAAAFNVTCPSCGKRLRFALTPETPARLRIQCSACNAVFGVRRPGTDPSLPRPADLPTLTGTAIPSPRPPGAPAFAPGEILAERYRVIRFLARGGMGEVYEVEDRVLGERVAAKTVRSEVARDANAIERFKREIQLARKVTHPNVCRIFDVSLHRPEGSPESTEPVLFLTMELLAGETLARRLERAGPLEAPEGLEVARQIAAALEAAHQAGVIHRDLKPGNVLLVPAGDGNFGDAGGIRAVVTDFGLARGRADDSGLTLAATEVLGTPAYIAPEQVSGGEITPAVDIYAFGIVLYEMATGKLPFTGDTALATAVKRLTELPPPPHLYKPGLDPRWEAAILRCLERDPARRFPIAPAVIDALSGRDDDRSEAIGETPPTLAQPASPASLDARRRRLSLVVLLLLALVAFAVAAYRYHDWRQRQRETRARLHLPEGPVVPRRSLAVLGFEDRSNRSGRSDRAGHSDAAWLSAALAEMLSTELASGDELRILSGEEVARMKIELKLGEADSLARDTLARIRHILGTDYVVLGSYIALDAPGGAGERQIRLDLRLQDTAAGETTSAVAESGSEAHLFDLVSRVGARLRHTLGATLTTAGQGARASLPPSPQAARLYAEGLTRLRLFDPAGARDLLARAAVAEPGNALIHESLAAAWSALGFEEKAREEARRALDLSKSLPQEERLLIEGRYRETIADWPKAVEVYRGLWSLFPDNLDYGLRLAAVESSAGQPEEALATAEGLRTLPPPAAEDPRIDLAEAAAAGVLADFKRQERAAARAAATGAAHGARLLVAQARLAECRALRNLGQAEGALAACDEGRRLYAEAGDRAGVAEALTHAANVLYDRGDLAGANQRYQQALTTYREIGNRGGEAGALNNIAVVLKSQGQLDPARQLYEQVLGLTREIGSRSGEAYALNNIAAVLLRRGELGKARGLFEQSLAIRREQRDRSGEAYALDNLGGVLRRQGDLAGALARHTESLALRRETGQKIGEVASLDNLGSVLLDRGELPAARERFEESLALARKLGNQSAIAHALFGSGVVWARQGDLAGAVGRHTEALSIRDRLGEKGNAAESRLALAGWKLELGDADVADALAGQAALELGRQGATDAQAAALAVAAQAANARGDRADIARARATMDQATALVAHGEDLGVRLAVAIRAARLAAATGRRAAAVAALGAAHDEAARAGLVEPRLQADLTLAEVAAAEGRTPEARGRFTALAAEARAKGYGLISRKIKGFA